MNLPLAMEGVSEVPNIITFLYHYYQNSPWLGFLHHWDAVFFAFIISSLLGFIFYLGTRNMALIPSGFQNFLEWIADLFDYFITHVLGPDGKKYVPFLATLFLYILSMNLFGIIPFMKSPTASVNVTVGMAICVFALVQYSNMKNMGLKAFLYNLAGSPKDTVGWVIAPLMFPIELLTQISRPVTLALRLFGNIMGEKVLIGFFTILSITFLFFLPIQLPFVLLGVFTGVIQAVVFTLLSTIYILLSKDNH
jgi:F-type H+-transporting ATPase subunit a